jgi:hypothetical protein
MNSRGAPLSRSVCLFGERASGELRRLLDDFEANPSVEVGRSAYGMPM